MTGDLASVGANCHDECQRIPSVTSPARARGFVMSGGDPMSDERPDHHELDEAIANANQTVKRLRLRGTHAQVAEAERYRDQLLEQRS